MSEINRERLREWIDEGLSKPGKTNAELAELLGIAPSRVSEMRRGLRRIQLAEMPVIAKYIEEPDPYGFEISATPSMPKTLPKTMAVLSSVAMRPRRLRVPLISWVSAGKMSFPDISDEIIGHVEDSELDPEGDWIALQVVGDSMDRISPPESIIFVDRADKILVPNACYVISNGDGEATYKRFRSSPMRFEPVSTNPEHQTIFPTREPLIVGRVKKSTIAM